MPYTTAGAVGIRPFDRRRQLTALASQQFGVLVIGGGITGCGVVLDAASRGLRAALVERDDVASGTSSRSSKLVHGGLRYLSSERSIRTGSSTPASSDFPTRSAT